MVDKYWVGGAGSWTTASTTNWSLISGGVSGAPVPTASDNVFFDQAGTYTVTVTGPLTCLNFTVSLGLVTFTPSSGSQTITISGSLSLSSGTVGTWSSSFIPTFNATTSQTITTNNEPIGAPTFNGVGGTWTLGSTFSVNNGALTLTNGTFSTSASNYAVSSANFSSNNSNTRTLNLNASTYTLTSTSWTCTTATGLTVSGSGATVTMTSASSKTFAGGGANWGAITLNQGGSGRLTISGSNTFANISNSYNATGATSIRFTSGTTQTVTSFTAEGASGKVLTIDSSTPGTAATLSKASGTVSVSFLSIQDSTATGGAVWNALDSTNVSGNTGWVITPPTRYWVGGSGTWDTSDTTHWSASSGGAGGASVPTSSEDVIFDQATTYTVSVLDVFCDDFTISAGVVSFTVPSGFNEITISGSMLIASGTIGSWPSGLGTIFNATTSKTITTNNQPINRVTLDGVGGTWTLGSDFTSTIVNGGIILTNGTFSTSASNYAVNIRAFSSNNSNTRTLNVNASTFTVTSSWTCTTATGLTVSGSGATVTMTNASAKTFAGGGANWSAITLDQGGAGQLTISGSNTFANISNSYNATAATSIRFTSGTTQTVTSFTAEGTAGKILTIDSTTPATAATLSKASGTVSVDYVSIQDSTATGGATWNAGSNSTNVSGNTGWVFAVSNRYWVGGAGTWDTSSTTNWSTSSGGASGASVPTAANNVVLDQVGTYTVTVTGALACLDFTVSAGIVTFALGTTPTLTISGDMSLASGTVGTWDQNFNTTFNATTSKTITTNGESIGNVTFNGVGGTWTLGSALTTPQDITLTNGTFSTSASNYAVSSANFSSDNANTRTLNVNASTFTVTSSWTCTTTTGLTVSGSGATATMTGASAKTFAGGSFNWGAITLDQGGAGALTINGSNTFANISNSYNATAATTIRFTSGTTQTITSFTAEGTAGKVLIIDSTTPATAATLSKTSGTVSVNYVSIQDSTATGGAVWEAGFNSTDVSGNTGWIFLVPPPVPPNTDVTNVRLRSFTERGRD